MAVLDNLLVRIGVDESGVGRGVDRSIRDFDRFGDAGERLGARLGEAGQDAGRAFGDGFTRDANGRLRDSLGRFASEGTGIGRGIGTNIADGLKGSGPGMAIALAAALSLLPAVGALVATGLVLLFGAAFTKIGLKAAATNKGVQAKLDGLKKHVDKTLKKISQPFVQTWHTILDTARSTFDKLAPELAKAFKHIAPAVSRIVEQIGKGFEKLAPSIEPLGRAFSRLLDAIGPAIPGIMQGIGDAITDIATVIAENPDLFAGFITGLIKIIPWALKFVAVLAKVFNWVGAFMGTTNALVVVLGLLFTPLILVMGAFRKLKDTLAGSGQSFGSVWDYAKTKAQQFWAFISPALTLIATLFSTAFTLIKTVVMTAFRIIKAIIFGDFGQVKATIRSGIASIKAAWSAFWNALKRVTSTAWEAIKAAVKRAWSAIKSAFTSGVNGAKTLFRNGWNAIRNSATSGASRLIGVVRRIPGRIRNALGNVGNLLRAAGRRVVQGLIDGIRSMLGRLGGAMGDIAGKIRGFLPFSPAKEGPLSGSGNPARSGEKIAAMLAGGMTSGTGMVARAASTVAGAAAITPTGVSAPAGVRAAAAAAGGGQTITIRSGGGRLERLLVEVLQAAIAEQGGNVQTVLGRGRA